MQPLGGAHETARLVAVESDEQLAVLLELTAPSAVLDEMMAEVAYGDHSRAAKLLSVDTSLKSRHRGRRQK